jgi:UDP:flavonoid glycosyltransferase YjiC (YdhE family)
VVSKVVGTFGDVQPFLLIAKALKRDGHRVRLATHPEFRCGGGGEYGGTKAQGVE